MNHRRRILVLAMSAATLTGTLWAGSLEPPPGPAAPTMKTLDEVEARKPIHQSDLPLTIIVDGSYYLAENLNANQNGVDMIRVVATTVAIDLNGFTMNGTSELAQAAAGIRLDGSVRAFSLSNGFIRGCASYGFFGAGDVTVTVTNVHASGNLEGIVVGGSQGAAVISNCVAKGNVGRGIIIYKGVIQDSVTIANGTQGMQAVYGLVRGCVSYGNTSTNVQPPLGGLIIDTYAP